MAKCPFDIGDKVTVPFPEMFDSSLARVLADRVGTVTQVGAPPPKMWDGHVYVEFPAVGKRRAYGSWIRSVWLKAAIEESPNSYG